MYTKIKDNNVVQYPYGFDELFADNPYTNFDIIYDLPAVFATTESGLNGHTLEQVRLVQPISDHTKNYTEGTPSLSDGIWTQTWNVTDASQEEINSRVALKTEEVQQEIVRLKSEIPTDVSEELQSSWQIYTLQLDITSQQPSYPWRILWPNKPQ